ncbi:MULTISPECIES: hypothetical protein [unclassified Acidovorax]|jgi:hypothetical protein|uniref:hypothetical protein n=1 Tax=unclassified Acidovorax TaxID=2684926 RepID=UPI00117856C0|nr:MULTISPECIES: hypothetical protein [unclassified Acidovorax]MBL7088707.1 hypothetical protein [Acidovorax sp.]
MIFLSRRRSRAQPTIGFVKWLKNINHQTKPALAQKRPERVGIIRQSCTVDGQSAGKPGV